MISILLAVSSVIHELMYAEFFRDNKYFPSSWKDDDLGYLSMDLKSFYVQCTQGEVKDSDGQVKYRIDLDELLGMITVSMDFDVVSVEGDAQIQACMQVQQVILRGSSVVWDLYRLTCVGAFWTPL